MRSPTLLSSVPRDWLAIEQPSWSARREGGEVCKTSYGGPIRVLLRRGSADAWPACLGGKWASGHLALAHSTGSLDWLPCRAADSPRYWFRGDVCETSYGGPIRFLLRQGSADAWPARFGGKWASGHLALAYSSELVRPACE